MADHLSHLGDLLDPWDFSLPDAQIAREPAAERDLSRLYRVGAEPGVFADIVAELRAGDLLVMNDVRVFRARLRAFRASGGAVEAMISAPALRACSQCASISSPSASWTWTVWVFLPPTERGLL